MLSAVEFYDTLNPDDKKGTTGILEFIIKDKNGRIVDRIIEKNIIKIFAKEMLSHRLPSSQVWDVTANGGEGGWVSSNVDSDNEFSARYIIFGASFDQDGTPLGTSDTRYYTQDPVTGQFVPIRLEPGANYGGGLINAIPLFEPYRPVKKVEKIEFNSTYQPTGTPLVDSSVRAINNILVVETVLRTTEYNGFTGIGSDFFTITEVALAGGKTVSDVGQCGLIPIDLFLDGKDGTTALYDSSVDAISNGSNIISISQDEANSSVNMFKKGDQIKIVNRGGTQDSYDELDQINSSYLIVDTSGGRDLVLDRVPVDSNGSVISGDIGIFRNTLKIFSHRVLSTPVQKSASFEITVRWTIIFN